MPVAKTYHPVQKKSHPISDAMVNTFSRRLFLSGKPTDER
jgi:hypothetical protein